MRVLLFKQGHSESAVTGGERRFRSVMGYLKNKGVDVINVDLFHNDRNIRTRNPLFMNLRYFLWLCRHHAGHGLGNTLIIQDYSERFYYFIFNWLAHIFFNVTIVGFVNAFYFHYRNSKVKNFIDSLVSRLFFLPLRLVVAGGNMAAREIYRLGVDPSKIHSVYPALRKPFLSLIEDAKGPSDTSQSMNGITQLLSVGRLHPVKGYEYLIDAMALANDSSLKLTIVGDVDRNPKYAKRLFDKASSLSLNGQVTFTGEIKELETLVALYKTADVFVLPSVWETSPHALMEAMCAGIPVVGSRIGGITEWVQHGVSGILVPPRNSQALASGLLKLAHDGGLRKRMGREGRSRSLIFRDRTWEDVGKEYFEILLQLAARGCR